MCIRDRHSKYLAPHAKVAGDDKLDAGVALTGFIQRVRQLHLDVAGGIQDKGNGDDALGVARGAVEPVIEQHIGVLDKADFNPPFGMKFAPLRGEIDRFFVALAAA